MEWVEKVNGFFKMIPVSRVCTLFPASKWGLGRHSDLSNVGVGWGGNGFCTRSRPANRGGGNWVTATRAVLLFLILILIVIMIPLLPFLAEAEEPGFGQ